MAKVGDGNKIGEVRVDVTADTDKLRRGLTGAEQQARQSANKMGREFDEGFGKRVDKSLDPLTRIQSILGKLLVPVAVITSLAGLFSRWKAIREETEKAELALRNYETRILQLRQSFRGPDDSLSGELRRVREEYGALVQQATDASLERELKAAGFFGSAQRLLFGGETPAEIRERLKSTVALAGVELNKALDEARERDRKRQEAAKRARDEQRAAENEAFERELDRAEELGRKNRQRIQDEHNQRMANIAKEAEELERRTASALLSAQRAANAEANADLRALTNAVSQIGRSVEVIRRRGGL